MWRLISWLITSALLVAFTFGIALGLSVLIAVVFFKIAFFLGLVLIIAGLWGLFRGNWYRNADGGTGRMLSLRPGVLTVSGAATIVLCNVFDRLLY